MERPLAVLFDIDGTLISTGGAGARSWRHAFDELYGIPADIGQFTDHRVMALGDNKVWVNGQVTPLEQLQTGPNFLGWEHPVAPAPVQTAVTTSATAPADPQVNDQTPTIPGVN